MIISISIHVAALFHLFLWLSNDWNTIYSTVYIMLLFSRSVMSASLRPHGLQQGPGLQEARLPCRFISRNLLKLMFIDSVMPCNHPVLCCPLFLLPSVSPSINACMCVCVCVCVYECVCVHVLSPFGHVHLFATLWAI